MRRFDTIVGDLPASMLPDRPCRPGDKPKTAGHEFLGSHPAFEVDRDIDYKRLDTVANSG